jgi:hypothetical protein
MMALHPPFLSEFDQEAQADSGVDALGLQAMYERLADWILPALTVRMSRPRFATAIALGSVVCEGWEDDEVAKDGVSPPWMVFEWYVAESLVRCREKLRDGQRIPGRLKIETALRQKRPISAASYLKTASIFGFTGIYKRLAIALGIVTDNLRLDDAGYNLVAAWERDTGMSGFQAGREGEGAGLRDRLKRAVDQGLQVGRTVPLSGALYEQIALLTEPVGAGRSEAKLLTSLLCTPKKEPEMAAELVNAIIKGEALVSPADEPGFLRGTARHASEALQIRLHAIDAFESLCRPITDAFDGIRRLSTEHERAPIGVQEFREYARKSKLVQHVQDGVARACADPVLLEKEPGVRSLVDCFMPAKDPESLFRSVLDHHAEAQRKKPPDGKRPWIVRLAGDQVSVRAAYVLDGSGDSPEYVHRYRTTSLSMFLKDLRRLS